MSEYPSKEDYTQETLRNDGGPGDLIAAGRGSALSKSPRMSSKDMAMAEAMLPDEGTKLKDLGRAALTKNPRMSKSDMMTMESKMPKPKKKKGPR